MTSFCPLLLEQIVKETVNENNHRHPQHPTLTDDPESCPNRPSALGNDTAVSGSYGSWIVNCILVLPAINIVDFHSAENFPTFDERKYKKV